MWQSEIARNVRHNFTVNVLDAAFFGSALGFASFVTIIPLFLNSVTDSTLLIGLVASMHTIGWQLPQMLTSHYVARLRRYKPMVMFMTVHERWPFFGLAVVALLVPVASPGVIALLTVLLLIIHSMSGGLAATAWQSMIGKIMPRERRATFFGIQSGIANMMAAGAAILAGFLLDKLPSPIDFAICFGLAGVTMMISLAFLAKTREPAHDAEQSEEAKQFGWRKFVEIVKRDGNFRWFLVARVLSQIAWMSVSFYTIYAVRHFGMDAETAGVLTSVLLLSQTVASPLLGWVGDRWGHRVVYAMGALLITLSAALAFFAPELGWFYVAFGLAGFSNATVWGIAMTFTLEFGTDAEKPLYIGLANTLIAPVGLIAPIVGGAMADSFGFQSTFSLCIVAGLLTAALLYFVVRDPHRKEKAKAVPATLALEDSGVW